MSRRIIIAEDSEADADILSLALWRRDPDLEIQVFENGEKVIAHFSSAPSGSLPCELILLDLNLPRINGFEVLEFLKSDPRLKAIPVVVLSGSSSKEDVSRCYDSGANSYICKPIDIEELFEMARTIVTYWFEQVQLPTNARASRRPRSAKAL
jgi:CheY-like chemotaxis protein